jgi:hypothetical protein
MDNLVGEPAGLAEREAHHAEATAARIESKLLRKLDAAHEKLHRTAERARKQLEHTRHELDTMIAALEEQAAKATPEVRTRIEERVAELRREFNEREHKLVHAYELTMKALHPRIHP